MDAVATQIAVWVHEYGPWNRLLQNSFRVVVQAEDDLPLAFADALLDRMKGGSIPGHRVYLDEVRLEEKHVLAGGFTHCHKNCSHVSAQEAIDETLSWVFNLARQHGIEVIPPPD
jgi:hypothetical protein